jgi:hypothetical protein
MYSRETLVLLKYLPENGQSRTAFAGELGISRRLVYHRIATGQLERDLSGEAPVSGPPPRPIWRRSTRLSGSGWRHFTRVGRQIVGRVSGRRVHRRLFAADEVCAGGASAPCSRARGAL